MRRFARVSVTVLACALLTVFLLVLPARADTGPKPSVRVTFENLGSETCYGTLLSKDPSTGPQSAWDGNEEHIYKNSGLGMDIWRAFVQYEDTDGFFFLQCAWEISTSGQLAWTYYPPQTFKILLYYPDSGRFVVSGVCERYAFDSYFAVDMAQESLKALPSGTTGQIAQVKRSYSWGGELGAFVVRVLLTIAVEMGIAWLFGIRGKKPMMTLLAVNGGTQLFLNVALNIAGLRGGRVAFVGLYILLELAVFGIEAILYGWLLPRLSDNLSRRRWYYALYAFVANAVSFCTGLAVAAVLPGVF